MHGVIFTCTTLVVIFTAAALPTFNTKERQNIIQPPRIVYQTSVRKSQGTKTNELTPKTMKTVYRVQSKNEYKISDEWKENGKKLLSILPAPPTLLPRREKPKKTDQKKDTDFIFRAVGDHVANIKVGPVFPNGIRPDNFHYDMSTAPVFIPEQDEDIFKYEQFNNDTTLVEYKNTANSAKVSQITISEPPQTPLFYLPVNDLKNQAKYEVLRDAVLKVLKIPGTIVGVLVASTLDTNNSSVDDDSLIVY